MAAVMSLRMVTIAYLTFFMLVALASSAAIERNERNMEPMENSGDDTDEIVNLDMGDIDHNYRRALVILKRVLARAKAPDSTDLMTPFRKRTCYFNAGMSHSCDYKELLTSMDDANYWSSDTTPGRRRKRSWRAVNPVLPLGL